MGAGGEEGNLLTAIGPKKYFLFLLRGARVAQLVELHLAKVVVAGSSPVSRSILLASSLPVYPRFRGGIAKW